MSLVSYNIRFSALGNSDDFSLDLICDSFPVYYIRYVDVYPDTGRGFGYRAQNSKLASFPSPSKSNTRRGASVVQGE